MRSKPSAIMPRVNLMQPIPHLHMGSTSKWNYALWVIDLEGHSLSDLLQPLETAITSMIFPALTGQSPPGDIARKLLALLHILEVWAWSIQLKLLLSNIICQSSSVLHWWTEWLIRCSLLKIAIHPNNIWNLLLTQKSNQNGKRMPKNYTHNCQEIFKDVLSSHRRKEHLYGWQLYPLKTMPLLSTNLPLGMPCVSDTTSLQTTNHLNAIVVTHSVSIMLCHVQQAAFPQSDTMKLETSLLHCFQKYAMVFPLNHIFSLSLGRRCPSAQPTLMITLGLT